METRYLFNSSELRAVVTEGRKQLQGKIPYNSLSDSLGFAFGSFRERIHPDAFKDSLQTQPDVRALAFHDETKPIGRAPDTLRIENRADGLYYTVDLPDTSYAKDLHESVSRGDVRGTSFGFRTVSDSWNMENGEEVRTLLKADLHEISPVVFPAYPDTSVAARSRASRSGFPARNKLALWILEQSE